MTSGRCFYQLRNRIAQARQDYAPKMSPGEIAERMESHGYPTDARVWSRVINNAVITQHMCEALADAFDVRLGVIVDQGTYDTLDHCRNPKCDH